MASISLHQTNNPSQNSVNNKFDPIFFISRPPVASDIPVEREQQGSILLINTPIVDKTTSLNGDLIIISYVWTLPVNGGQKLIDTIIVTMHCVNLITMSGWCVYNYLL